MADRIDLISPIIDIDKNKLGVFTAKEWYRLLSPFTPHRTGIMEGNVDIRPFEIEYNEFYSPIVYNGVDFNFRQDFNPFATHHWDDAAADAGQLDKLAVSVAEYIRGNI